MPNKPSRLSGPALFYAIAAAFLCAAALVVNIAGDLASDLWTTIRNNRAWFAYALLLSPIAIVAVRDALKNRSGASTPPETPEKVLPPEQRELRRAGQEIQRQMQMREARLNQMKRWEPDD